MIQEYNKAKDYSDMVKVFCHMAIKCLGKYYVDPLVRLPYTTRKIKTSKWNLIGESLRYAAICQIGIQRWLYHHPEDQNKLPDLWPALRQHLPHITDVGDSALCLWAAVDAKKDDILEYAQKFYRLWQSQKERCNAVELGWAVQASVLSLYFNDSNINNLVEPILKECHSLLTGLFNQKTQLFYRNYRGGRLNIDSHVACFADQVYPILALSTYADMAGDDISKEYAGAATDSICHYQGSLGQWMWHYDVKGGKVCEEYPVFSVHQHSMAPMAVLASDRTNHSDHSKYLQSGMRWLFGNNELEQNLVCREDGIIWRDIERKEIPKMSRTLRGLCCVAGFSKLHAWLKNSPWGFKVNYECRPYELGWILYAWADYHTHFASGNA